MGAGDAKAWGERGAWGNGGAGGDCGQSLGVPRLPVIGALGDNHIHNH